nr:ATP-binding protein [Burkholderia stagnalis]
MGKAEREGNLAQSVRFLARNSLLIIDKIGYLPIGSNGGNLLFQLVNAAKSEAPRFYRRQSSLTRHCASEQPCCR